VAVNSTVPVARTWPRWLSLVGLWLLLSCIFSSQLYFSGYVTPWPRAFAAEAFYWFTWGLLAPAVFWMCRRVHHLPWSIRGLALLSGAFIAVALQPVIGELIMAILVSLGWCFGDCTAIAAPFTNNFVMRATRVAGVNLPVYAGFVLAWHASAYHRESRDRAMRAVELESSLQQAQLAALRSQLNPHFLFNALHSMAELVHVNPKLAEDLIVRLGELLRKVLESSHSQEVTLSEELEFIRGYVEIEQMRLGGRLQVSWDIDPDALRARVPSLVLQPLVENAILHGISPLTQPGTLAIRAARADGSLLLEVRDSGPGVDSIAKLSRSGIGLANTRVRLESLYGTRQSLELANHDGFTVRVRIPFSAS
jgi:two-component system LytT family sensor kinase